MGPVRRRIAQATDREGACDGRSHGLSVAGDAGTNAGRWLQRVQCIGVGEALISEGRVRYVAHAVRWSAAIEQHRRTSMASAEENIATIRRGYDAFNAGDMATLGEVFAEKVVWHNSGRGRFAGETRGRDATFAYFGQIAELTGGNFRAELHDVAASEAHVAGIQTNTGTRNGKSLNLKFVIVFHLEGGKIVEAWENAEDTQTWDEFFA
jgi:uncharacterized protein